MLSKKQLQVIELLVEGNMTKVDISKYTGVPRRTIYTWLSDNKEFKETLEKLTQIRTEFVESRIKNDIEKVYNEMWKLYNNAESEHVKYQILENFMNRAIGKPTTKMDIELSPKKEEEKEKQIFEDLIEAEGEIVEDIEENNEK